MANAIVINIPETETDCFIAMPFSEEEFGVLYRSILEATTGLTTLRTDRSPKVDFVRDIMNNLMSANIIICVCSLESSSKKPNSNVMYELGIAHAIGKPTIIVTNSINSLPSDLATKYAIEYTQEEMKDTQKRISFVNKLKLRIEETLQRSKRGLIDPDWEAYGISLIHVKYKMLLHFDFLTNFKTIISFEDTIQTNFQPIASELIQLRKFLEDIVANASNDLKRIRDFTTTWYDYRNYCKETQDEFLNSLQSKIKENDDCFYDLVEKAIKEGDKNAKKSIEDAQQSYKYIKEGLAEFKELDQQLQSSIGNDLAACLRDVKQANKLVAPIAQLVVQTKSFLVQSHNLVSNLIKIIPDLTKAIEKR